MWVLWKYTGWWKLNEHCKVWHLEFSKKCCIDFWHPEGSALHVYLFCRHGCRWGASTGAMHHMPCLECRLVKYCTLPSCQSYSTLFVRVCIFYKRFPGVTERLLWTFEGAEDVIWVLFGMNSNNVHLKQQGRLIIFILLTNTVWGYSGGDLSQ